MGCENPLRVLQLQNRLSVCPSVSQHRTPSINVDPMYSKSSIDKIKIDFN
jgi:hypothetical protein